MKTKKLLIGLLAGALLFNSTEVITFAAETTETEIVVDSATTTTTETALEATDTETTDTNTEVTPVEEALTEEEKIAAEQEKAEAEKIAAEQEKAEAEKKADEAAAEKAAAKKAALKKKQTAEYSKQVKYLAALIYTEAGNQSYKGKVAVANVVLNRAGSKITAEKIRDVIYAPNQFSVVRNGSFEQALNNYSDFDSADEKECIKAAKAALDGKNYVGGREYFTRYTKSLANSHPSGVKIGDHYFW